MKRAISVLVGVLLAGALSLVPATTANASTKCTSGGVCVTLSAKTHHSVVVQTVVLTNSTKKKKTNMHCGFSSTISRSFSTSKSVSAEVKLAVSSFMDLTIAGEQTTTIEQTASDAVEAAGDIKLNPGEGVVCKRTYGYYTETTKVTEYVPVAKTYTFTSTMPYAFGVDIDDLD